MANNKKNNPQSGSKGSMSSDKDREFDTQGHKKDFGGSGQGQQAGGSRKETDSHKKMEDDDMSTAGGREGQFADSKRGTEGQWSPGSSQSTEE